MFQTFFRKSTETEQEFWLFRRILFTPPPRKSNKKNPQWTSSYGYMQFFLFSGFPATIKTKLKSAAQMFFQRSHIAFFTSFSQSLRCLVLGHCALLLFCQWGRRGKKSAYLFFSLRPENAPEMCVVTGASTRRAILCSVSLSIENFASVPILFAFLFSGLFSSEGLLYPKWRICPFFRTDQQKI